MSFRIRWGHNRGILGVIASLDFCLSLKIIGWMDGQSFICAVMPDDPPSGGSKSSDCKSASVSVLQSRYSYTLKMAEAECTLLMLSRGELSDKSGIPISLSTKQDVA